MTQASQSFGRRRMLVASAALMAGAAAGCRAKPQPEVIAEPNRTDVPLRLALVGTEQDAEAIRRGWGAVTEQPLQIDRIDSDRSSATAMANAVLEASRKSDVMLYPLALVSQASVDDAIVPLAESEIEEIELASGALCPSIRSGAAKYAGQHYAVPLGGSQPAMLVPADDNPTIESWSDYDKLVGGEWKGAAGEPSAPGWAASMFLWRAATSVDTWLFRRETLEPLLTTDPYVATLDLMVRTHKRYTSGFQTPGQVWEGVLNGKLRGGVGFPTQEVVGEGECSVRDLPGTNEISKVLLDPFSPVISLSAHCRQSATAKRFIGWVAGGEGADAIRRQVRGMTNVRRISTEATVAETGSRGDQAYRRWLANRLETPVTLPTMQLIRACEYYAVLEDQVGKALEGTAAPAEALKETYERWQTITSEVGLEKQRRAWRRAQGMRA